MKLAGFVIFALFSSCGGSNPVGGSALPPPRANTPIVAFLPLGAGNAWTFGSGAQMRDMGLASLSCSCALAGLAIEQIDVYDASQTYAGSLFYTKATLQTGASAGQRLTYLAALSSDHGATAFYPSDTTDGAPGVVVTSDTPAVGERFDDFNGAAVSTITSINGTQNYQAEQITAIALDQLVATGWNGTLGFAQGVGFTSLASNAGSVALTAFTVGPSSQSMIRRTMAAATSATGVGAATFLPGAGQIVNSAITGHSIL